MLRSMHDHGPKTAAWVSLQKAVKPQEVVDEVACCRLVKVDQSAVTAPRCLHYWVAIEAGW